MSAQNQAAASAGALERMLGACETLIEHVMPAYARENAHKDLAAARSELAELRSARSKAYEECAKFADDFADEAEGPFSAAGAYEVAERIRDAIARETTKGTPQG